MISIGRRGAALLVATTAGAVLVGGVAIAAPRMASESGQQDGYADAVVALANAERQQAGCPDLVADERLEAAAEGHAADMAEDDYFSHTSDDGREFNDRVAESGYPRRGGENIAMGQDSPQRVVEAWMESPSHRSNIVNCDYATIGVGHHSDGNYWVQDFGY
ncbi:CAP domain-containing protein [Pseudonocardia nigra]|uniref:CAP domain-containing protein n=1 Tax=Pseudonocardia nigra TaxID=1921578 RepID=UPI001C5EC1A0|nr:CAP domain-containing protein [Pseudonocardia nigra]